MKESLKLIFEEEGGLLLYAFCDEAGLYKWFICRDFDHIDSDYFDDCEEIPNYLYDALVKFAEEKNKKNIKQIFQDINKHQCCISHLLDKYNKIKY